MAEEKTSDPARQPEAGQTAGERVDAHDSLHAETDRTPDEAGEKKSFRKTVKNCFKKTKDTFQAFGRAVENGFMETMDTFAAFAKAPQEIIGINIINVFEGMAYFGTLTLLMLFMTKNVLVTDAPFVDISQLNMTQFRACFQPENVGGCVDVHAGWIVSGFLMLITLSQLFLGGLSDKIGPKRMLGVSILILLAARAVMGFSELLFAGSGTGLGSTFFFVVIACLLCAALAYGVFNPAIYSLTRMYSDKKTSAVSYAMLYAGMNLGAFLIGLFLPHIRRFTGDSFDESGNLVARGLLPGTNGYSGALIFIAGIMVIVFLLYFFMLARSKTKPLLDPNEPDEAESTGAGNEVTNSAETESNEQQKAAVARPSLIERLKRHPLADLKFDFFIFILIPVQTLFAYQSILIPTYLERCFRAYPTISDNFETFSNLNPLIVFFCAPIIAALTAKSNVYKMMILGTTVMALPSFLLAVDTNPILFLTFIFTGSIGESMWQPRFLQHVTQIAPKDRMGAYVGIANLPWFMTKFIVGLYVGFFIQGYIPDPSFNPEQNPQTMWLIFACIAMISPIALFLARKWMNPENPSSGSDTSDASTSDKNEAPATDK